MTDYFSAVVTEPKKNQFEKAPKPNDRIVGQTYIIRGGKVGIWNGKIWHCVHKKRRNRCIECGGSGICVHKKQKRYCIECDGSGICVHKKQKRYCIECDGSEMCVHKKQKRYCIECDGSEMCVHKKQRRYCIECDGFDICVHKKERRYCIECDGSGICVHKKRREYCIECDGSEICVHKKRRRRCIECDGSEICVHKKQKRCCIECDPNGHLTHLMRSRVYNALKRYSNPKEKRTMEYVGCDVDTLREHLEKQFTEGMTWENQGDWHVDHRKPCASFDLNKEEERHRCFHYTNLQPLWGSDNLSKSSKHDELTFRYIWKGESVGWKIKIL